VNDGIRALVIEDLRAYPLRRARLDQITRECEAIGADIILASYPMPEAMTQRYDIGDPTGQRALQAYRATYRLERERLGLLAETARHDLALAAMSETQRRILQLRWEERRPLAEVAESLMLSRAGLYREEAAAVWRYACVAGWVAIEEAAG